MNYNLEVVIAHNQTKLFSNYNIKTAQSFMPVWGSLRFPQLTKLMSGQDETECGVKYYTLTSQPLLYDSI